MELKRQLNCILLIDDDEDDNYIHKRIINKSGVAKHIETAENGAAALEYLRKVKRGTETDCYRPDLIFLDINMPAMNGWEFLEAYAQEDDSLKADSLIMMLTTSLNPDDLKKAEGNPYINGFSNKPLTHDILKEIINKFFPDYF